MQNNFRRAIFTFVFIHQVALYFHKLHLIKSISANYIPNYVNYSLTT